LLQSIDETSSKQRDAIELLVNQSNTVLKEVSDHFKEQVGSEVTKVNDIADQFAASAVEMSALGESFNVAVQLFGESNQTLIENLSRIEESLNQASDRSNEQLAYYVSQAREIIDHSMMAQKDILEEMRLLSAQQELFVEEAVS